MIQDREQQMERWVEHYTELYAKENVVTEDALNAIECLPELEKLDGEPTQGSWLLRKSAYLRQNPPNSRHKIVNAALNLRHKNSIWV